MSDPYTTSGIAADYLATDARMQAAVRSAGGRYAGWLVAFAATNLVYLTGVGLLREDPPVLWLTAAYLLSVAMLCLGFFWGARITPAGFARRFAGAMVSWAALYALTLVIGLLAFRGQPVFWLPAAIVCAVPLLLGARAEVAA
jgi:hypothetical protein